MSASLLDLLEARRGIVCAVGAGGKKATLYRLAALHPGRVAITSTVHIPPPPKNAQTHVIVMEQENLAEAVEQAACSHQKIAYFQPSEKRGRFAGVAPEMVRAIQERAGFDLTLVKADGARSRLIKAPGEDEPHIPDRADTVLALVSARAIGEPLAERIAHRVEELEAVTGARAGEPLEPKHLARLLASEKGLLKGVGSAIVIAIINMVDDPARMALAVETAQQALTLNSRLKRVVLTSMRRDNPIVKVLER
jgi:probable selenium-dependent hydroxylase accessory protein YqeC